MAKTKALTMRQHGLLNDLARGADVVKVNGWEAGYSIYAAAPSREYIGRALPGTVDALVRAGYAITTREASNTNHSRTFCTITGAGRAFIEAR